MYLIVGNGKVARHLSHYLNELSVPFVNWSRAKNSTEEFFSLVQKCDTVLLAIKDDAIKEFYHEFIERFEKPTVHFSGCLEIEDLISAHPLVSFGPKFFDLDFYKTIPFVTTTKQELKSVFKDLPNQIIEIKAEQKAYYHAQCVMAANFSTLLWQNFFKVLRDELDFPDKAGVSLLESMTENILSDTQKSLTGPFIRKDFKTIKQNLKALEKNEFQEVYRAFLKSYFTPQELKNL